MKRTVTAVAVLPILTYIRFGVGESRPRITEANLGVAMRLLWRIFGAALTWNAPWVNTLTLHILKRPVPTFCYSLKLCTLNIKSPYKIMVESA